MAFGSICVKNLIGFRSDLLCLPGVNHIFSTRKNGVSFGSNKELNLGFSCGPADEVRANFKLLCEAFGINYKNLVLAKQTHHDIIHIVKRENAGNGILYENRFDSVDAMITNHTGIPIAVFYADCVPILLFDPRRRVIAACHSGWRGTALEIVRKTVRKMQIEFECDPNDILAAIGPCLCQEHFETSEDVYEKLCTGEKRHFAIQKNNKYYIDLKGINRYLLESSGVLEEHIDVSKLCGVCSNDLFFSHRKENGKTGRLAAVIQLTDTDVID